MQKRESWVFSPKQLKVFHWWKQKTEQFDGIICDGAIRSGKSSCMAFSFLIWACSHFEGESFAICGVTLGAVKRNVIRPLLQLLEELGCDYDWKASENFLEMKTAGRKNRFYLFGGQDEGAAARIQGATFAGILLDETALMPRSFVEQALARCSRDGAKFWFNCNPEHPQHWFYEEWIQKAAQKKVLYLHFTMDDNPGLSEMVKQRYRNLYSGHFYQRFIEGKWVASEGLVYPQFSEKQIFDWDGIFERYVISCDYGTVNPTSMGLWGKKENIWYRIDEFYYDSRRSGKMKTDEEYYQCLKQLAGEHKIEGVIVDPSAASFLEVIRRHGRFFPIPAKNDVLSGIRRVSEELRSGRLMVHRRCKDCIREFGKYCWSKGKGEMELPKKENDHAMDEVRYFVNTIVNSEADRGNDNFFAVCMERGRRR